MMERRREYGALPAGCAKAFVIVMVGSGFRLHVTKRNETLVDFWPPKNEADTLTRLILRNNILDLVYGIMLVFYVHSLELNVIDLGPKIRSYILGVAIINSMLGYPDFLLLLSFFSQR
jgi:hypothetical protein